MNRLEWAYDDLMAGPEDVWDDIAQFTPEQVADRFELTSEQAMILWQVIQSYVDVNRNVSMQRPSKIGHMINTALYRGLDEWTIEQGLIIRAFLSDIAYQVTQIEEDMRLARLRGQIRES